MKENLRIIIDRDLKEKVEAKAKKMGLSLDTVIESGLREMISEHILAKK